MAINQFLMTTSILVISTALGSPDARAEANSGTPSTVSGTASSPQTTRADTTSATPVSPASVGRTDPGAAGDQVADIVVTANKREQRLNDVGLAVAVVGGTDLRNRQIVTLQDIAQNIPSLSYSVTQSGTPVYTLRGVGFNDTSLAAYPTVSVYLDEAPLPFGALTRHSAYDLQRVEVLKGPQGTLFGQNSTGGAVNYIAAKPTNTLEAGLDVTYGRFNQVNGEAFISGPLSSTLKARLAGRIEHADGWQVSNSRPNGPDRTNGKVRNYMGRLLLDFEPTDRLRFSVDLNGWKDKSDTIAGQFVGTNIQFPGFEDPAVVATPFSPQQPRAADWTPGVPHADNRLLQGVFRADIDLSDSLTLTSLTAYTDYKQRQGQDIDGLPVTEVDLPSDNGTISSFSEEVRLSNGSSGRFRWVVGGNLERDHVKEQLLFDYVHNSTTRLLGTFYGYPITTAYVTTDQKMRNYAGFANAEFSITPEIVLKAGGRYTVAEASQNTCDGDVTGSNRDLGAFIYDISLGGAFGRFSSGKCVATNSFPTTLNGVVPGAPGPYIDSFTQRNFSWKAGIDYTARPGLLFYANVAKGYKAGGYPIIGATVFAQNVPLNQESVLSYEAGFKASLLDRALQLNATAFYYDYRDKQVRAKVLTQLYGIIDATQNIPKSKIKGFEIEANIRPTKGLTVNAAFTYLDAKISEFNGINGSGVIANFAGTRMPFTPKFQIAVNGDYDFAVSSSLNAFFGAGISERSDTTSVIGGDINPPGATPARPIYVLPSYALVDARIGVRAANDKWRLSLFGKNVFNEYYAVNVTQANDTATRYAGMPATYGVNLQIKY